MRESKAGSAFGVVKPKTSTGTTTESPEATLVAPLEVQKGVKMVVQVPSTSRCASTLQTDRRMGREE
jgi:hypothetical protein